MKLKLPSAKVLDKMLDKMWRVVAYLSVAIGIYLMVHGLWLFYKPSAYIVGGVLLAGAGFFSALDDKSDDGEGWE